MAQLTIPTAGELYTEARVDMSFDIPYLGGYSQDGSVIYLDRRLPPDWYGKWFLVLHEAHEKAFLLQGMTYQQAHRLATEHERSVVEASPVAWSSYQKDCQLFLEVLRRVSAYHVPPNLDYAPYVQTHDSQTIRRMAG
jgi:hypothetical protein